MRHYSDTNEVIAALKDLHKQATEERSHYYTGSVIHAAIIELECLQLIIVTLKQKLNSVKQ